MKDLLLWMVMCFTLPFYAQNVPNGDFEDWHTVGGWFENPDDWQTNNNQIIAPGVVKDSETPFGFFAMQVSNVTNIPGEAYTGFIRTVRPDNVHVFARSNIMTQDSAVITVLLYHEGDVVDSGTWYETTSKAWRQITIPVSQNTQEIDSLEVRVKAGKQIGTWMSVDVFSIEDPSGIGMDQSSHWTLFPNPMIDRSELVFDNPGQQSAALVVSDMLGEVVLMRTNIKNNTILFERRDFPAGLFLVILSIDGKEKGVGRLIVL
ncbi:MAG TPA: T9SS type A sorting domain-containing protein [Saprospiraceae bacterium]|nr:T9SS type A sorting domain-containing protein [Saprospiraceae bacterium]